MKFTFNRGSWEEGNILPEWLEDEGFDDYLERVGFNTVESIFGHEHGSHIRIFESTNGKSFYASVCPTGSTIDEVYLPDLPSLMIFIRDYASAFSNESSNSNSLEILQLLEKLFQLHHGHPAYSNCQQCDPIGWKEDKRRIEERREKQENKI